MSSTELFSSSPYGTFEVHGKQDQYNRSGNCIRSGCHILAEVTSTLAVPVVTALSWYFLAYNCKDELPDDCIEKELPIFLLATTGSIYTTVKIIKKVVTWRSEKLHTDEVLLNS